MMCVCVRVCLTLQINPGQQWWDDYEASLLPRMRHMPVDGLCEVMWAMGALRHRPARAWMEGFAGSLVPQLSVCTPDQLARLIWALAAVEEVGDGDTHTHTHTHTGAPAITH